MRITLHVERLILEGLPVTSLQAPLVQAAVEAELTRLLTSAGLDGSLNSGGATPRVSAPGIQLHNDNSPAQLGRQIAGAVHGGLNK